MSLRAMTWVLYESAAGSDACTPAKEHIDRLVLLAIADEASEDGTGAFPSHERLARHCACHKATVIRSIDRLERAGELLVKRPATPGRGRHNYYALVMGRGPGQVAAALGWPPPPLDPAALDRSHGATYPTAVDSPPAPPVSQTGNGSERSHETLEKVAPVQLDPLTRRPLGRKRVQGDPTASAEEQVAAQRELAARNAQRAELDVEPPADLDAARAAAAAARAALRTPAIPSVELDVEEPTA